MMTGKTTQYGIWRPGYHTPAEMVKLITENMFLEGKSIHDKAELKFAYNHLPSHDGSEEVTAIKVTYEE